MPAAVTYTTVLGQVLMENRGGIVTEFVPDPLGSVVKHKDSTGAYVHSAEYWPYGEIQTSTGNNPNNFAYCGTWGYYRDNASQTYVRARYYKPVQGRWMTVDPLWPVESQYMYCQQNPMVLVDPFGLQSCRLSQNECSKLRGSRGACIAFLCSLDSAADMAALIRHLGNPELVDIAIDIGLEGGTIPSLPTPSPESCCKEANTGRKEGPAPNPISQLIGMVCDYVAGGSGPFPCALRMRTFRGCMKCCAHIHPQHGSQKKIWCELACEARFGGENT